MGFGNYFLPFHFIYLMKVYHIQPFEIFDNVKCIKFSFYGLFLVSNIGTLCLVLDLKHVSCYFNLNFALYSLRNCLWLSYFSLEGVSLLYMCLYQSKKNKHNKRDGEHRNTKYQIRHSKYSSEIVWGSPFKVISYSFLIMRIPHRVPP